MSILAMRFSGPLQAWGSRSRFTERDTEMEPTRSGVIGLLCAALGRPRDASLEEFHGLRMAVRVDRAGTVIRDFHTALDVRRAGGGRTGEQAVISNRYYLADAIFLVLLEGDRLTLQGFDDALANPVWPLFLGRKSCPPGEPVRLEQGPLDEAMDHVLNSYPLLDTVRRNTEEVLRCVVEAPDGEETRRDVPLSFEPTDRRYGVRRVKTLWVPAVRAVALGEEP